MKRTIAYQAADGKWYEIKVYDVIDPVEDKHHLAIVTKLNTKIADLERSKKNFHITHDAMLDKLNRAMLLLKKNSLLDTYYKKQA